MLPAALDAITIIPGYSQPAEIEWKAPARRAEAPRAERSRSQQSGGRVNIVSWLLKLAASRISALIQRHVRSYYRLGPLKEHVRLARHVLARNFASNYRPRVET